MPARVNKVLLLSIVGALIVLVLAGTALMFVRRHSDTRVNDLRAMAEEYRVKGDKVNEAQTWSRILADRPNDVDARTRLVTLLEEQGQIGRAYQELQNVRALDPTNVSVLLKLARYEGQLQRWGEMKRDAKAVTEMQPKNAEARVRMAEACLGNGPDEYSEALDNAKLAVLYDHTNVEAWRVLARVHQVRQEPVEARKAYEAAVKELPENSDLWNDVAAFHQRMGEKPQAENALLSALKWAKDPVPAYIQLMAHSVSKKDWAGAEKYSKAACDNATSAMDRLMAFSAAGDYWVQRDNATMALKQYDEALVAMKDNPEVLLKKAQVLLSQKSWDDASRCIETVKRMGQQNRLHVMALFLDGQRLFQQDRADEAVREYESALSMAQARDLRMPLAEIYVWMAQAQIKLENLAAARDALNRAYAEAPGNGRILLAYARVLLATRDFDQIISILDVPNKPVDAYPILARAYMARGSDADLREAKGNILRALAVRPKDVELHLDLARIAARQKAWDAALKETDNAIRTRGDYVDAYLTQALIQDIAGRPKQVEETYRAAVEKLPDNMRLRMAWAGYLARKLDRFADAEKMLLDDWNARAADSPMKSEYGAEIPRFYLACGKTDKALDWYRVRALTDPKDVDGRLAAALILLSTGKVDEAQKLITEIRGIDGPKSIRALKLDGQILVMKGDFHGALDKMLEVEKSDPRDPDVQYYVGYCLLRTARAGTDDAQRSVGYLERVLAQFPTNNRVKRALVQAYYTVGAYDKANRLATELLKAGEQGMDLEVIQKDYATRFGDPVQGEAGWKEFTSKYPDRPEGWVGLAEALSRQNKVDEARAALEKAYALDPKATSTIWSLANLYRAQKEYDKAIEVTKKGLDTLEAAPKAPEFEANKLMMLGLLAQLYEMAGKPEQALAVYEQIGKLDPKNPMPAVAEAIKAVGANDLAAAERSLRKALELRPGDASIRQRLLEVLVTAQRFPDANAVIDKAMRENPTDVGLVVMKAKVRQAEGDIEGCIRQYRQAIKVARDRGVEAQNVVLYYELGQVLAREGRLAEAVSTVETARDLKPDFVEARMALVELAVGAQPPRLADARSECQWIVQNRPAARDRFRLSALLTLGNIAREEGKAAEAMTYYDRAASEFPEASDPLRRRAEMLVRDKKLDEALVQLKKAVALDKHAPSSVGLVADVLVSNKRYDEAIAFLTDEVKLCPEPAAVWMFMGNCEATRKDYPKAREYYDSALNLRGNTPQLYMARARTYLAEHNVDRAVAEARQALKVDPQFENAWVFIETALRDEKQRQADLRNVYEEWRRSRPDSPVAANNYAWFLTLTQKEPDAALKVLDDFRRRMEASGIRPQYAAELDDTEGYAWFQKGDYRKAVDCYKRSLEARPDAARTWDHLKLACLKLAERAKDQHDDLAFQRWQSEADRAYNRVLETAQPSFDTMSQLAEMRLSEGKVKEAIESFNAALAMKKDAEVERKLTELLIRDGRLDDAAKHVASLLAEDPKDAQNQSLDGMLLSANRKSDEAVKRFEGIVAQFPAYTSAHYLLAMEYAARGENDKAAKELDVVVAQSPQFLGARLVKARILGAQGNYDEAIVESQAVLKSDPMNFEAAYNMGNFQLARNKMTDAEATFRDLVKKWPDSVYAHERLAETFFRSNRLNDAVLEYQEARRANPKELVLLRGMCSVLQKQEKPEAVLREYNAFLEENPGNADAWLDLAGIHKAAGRWTDAERALKNVVRIAGANPKAHVLMLDFYMERRMYAEVRAAAKHLIEDVGTAEAKSVGHLYVARAWEAESRFDDAIAEYRASVAADKRRVDAVNNLAWLLLTRKNDADGAIAVGEPYLQNKEVDEFVELYDTLGWAWCAKKDYAKAEPLLKHAVAVMMSHGGMEKVNPVIACHYGEALALSGNKSEARKWLEYAGNHKEAPQQRALELLKTL